MAMASSGVLHVALGAMLVLTSAPADRLAGGEITWAGLARDGVIPLRDGAGNPAVGRNAMLDILQAPDGFAVRLTSVDGGEEVGLAWLSPSRGMWLALDRMTIEGGETVRAWQAIDDEPQVPLGALTLDDNGSGRMVVRWNRRLVAGPRSRVTLQVTGRRGFWPFGREPVVLSGTGRF